MQHHERGAPFLRVMRNQFVDFAFERRRHAELGLAQERIRDWLPWVHRIHRSHSPMTKSKEPRIATTSLIMWPGKSQGKMLRFTKDGARIFNRWGVPPPLLLM